MDYMPLNEATTTDEAVLPGTLSPGSSFPSRPRLGPEVLRYRGIVMNLLTGSVLVHGRPTQLSVPHRELLAALMRRCGQIVSPMWIATQLRVSVAEVDKLAASLAEALEEAGSSALPRRVEGLGYVLWR